MNNLFIEGPIQTGKSTLIRTILQEVFGPDLNGVAGFTSQRIMNSDGALLGFRLAPAEAELSIVADLSGTDNIFKRFTPVGPVVDMSVFETTGINYLEESIAAAKAGDAQVVLLDEIGGHELTSDAFRHKLLELLDSELPCIGVIKSPDNTRRMDPTLIQLNEELHAHLFAMTGLDAFEPRLRQYLESIL